MNNNNLNSIGVFDSGIGGLTVVKSIMERLPNENIIYFGDTARVPYGIKSKYTIEKFTTQIVEFLLKNNVKILVIACNTISAVAKNKVIQLAKNIPVIEVISCGAKEAVKVTKNNIIGVIATPTTINSNAYAIAISKENKKSVIISQACPLLVPLVEEGWVHNEIARLTIKEYLKPIIAENIDTLVLGCTHYPLLKPLIKEEISNNIKIIDSAITTANQVYITLDKLNLLNKNIQPNYKFYVSDIPVKFQTIAERFLAKNLTQVEMIKFD